MQGKAPGLEARDVSAAIGKQLAHQLRLTKQRFTWWLPWLFAIGLAVSLLGLLGALLDGSALARLAFALPSLAFGYAVLSWLAWTRRLKPRMVPYFARELSPYPGATLRAFQRGRFLYQELAFLDRIAREQGVEPLSAFGFADDHFGQEVRWHAASDGLRTLEALRRELDGNANRGVAADLEALAYVLSVAAEQGVAFSLVLRLHATESMQAVCTSEPRLGSFW